MTALLSKKKAMAFFKERALPRRTIDKEGKERARHTYRRVGPEELNRGESFPLIHNGLDTFSLFGIGVGIYFAQIALLTVLFFVGGMILVIGATEYQKRQFGDPSNPIPFSAVCLSETVNVTHGCLNGESSCSGVYRPNCALQVNTVIADLVVSLLFVVVIFVSSYFQEAVTTELDESVQTAQDYSIEVLDPDQDADSAQEWKEFFGQFGPVRYVTILRSNSGLTNLVLKKHLYTEKLQEAGIPGSKVAASKSIISAEYALISKQLDDALNESIVYPVCRVFVTFEHEESQRRCLQILQLPTLNAVFDAKVSFPVQYRFRRHNILRIREPSEPDSVLWYNMEVLPQSTHQARNLTVVLTFGLLVVVWFLLMALKLVSPRLMSIMIGFIDSILPIIFNNLVDMSFPTNEGKKQSRLQSRLFVVRFLLSTIFPYLQTPWDEFLSEGFLQQVFTTQLTASFFAPLFAWMDVSGLINRHILGPYFSDTQQEMNNYYMGTSWSLAEKYTGLAKVLFIALFYALLTPISLLIATIAFATIFLIDNYLLLRRYKSNAMIDASIATKLRLQAIISVAIHMIVTQRFIYSWPMDSVSFDATTGEYTLVDKKPSLAPWVMYKHPWHSVDQYTMLATYQVAMYIVIVIALYMCIFEPLGSLIYRWIYNAYESVGESQNIPFDKNANIDIYFPILKQPPMVTMLLGAHPMPESTREDEMADEELSLDVLNDTSEIVGGVRNHDPILRKRHMPSSYRQRNAAYRPNGLSTSTFGVTSKNKPAEEKNSSTIGAWLSTTKRLLLDDSALSSKSFLCSYAKNVSAQHRPVVICNSMTTSLAADAMDTAQSSVAKDDLTCYIPISRQREVLSIVEGFAISNDEIQNWKSPIDDPQNRWNASRHWWENVYDSVMNKLANFAFVPHRGQRYQAVESNTPPGNHEDVEIRSSSDHASPGPILDTPVATNEQKVTLPTTVRPGKAATLIKTVRAPADLSLPLNVFRFGESRPKILPTLWTGSPVKQPEIVLPSELDHSAPVQTNPPSRLQTEGDVEIQGSSIDQLDQSNIDPKSPHLQMAFFGTDDAEDKPQNSLRSNPAKELNFES